MGVEPPPRPPFHRLDFRLIDLIRARWASGMTISVCLPARDEEATVGAIIRAIQGDLGHGGLVDEVIVLDDESTDDTAAVARSAGARVVAVDEVPPQNSPRAGKGNAMWKSLMAARGDLICWVDADLKNFDPRFVVGLVGPLLLEDEVSLVKGFFRRPASGSVGGGRVTELVARPLISKLFPHLAGIVQPLAGATAGRREVLEAVPFFEGWGVEFALLVDVAERFGIESVAQVDLGTIAHDSQTLHKLGPQAMAVLTVALRRAGYDRSIAEVCDLVRFDAHHRMDVESIPVGERPPMATLREYRARFFEELPA